MQCDIYMLQDIWRLEHAQKRVKCKKNHLASIKCKKTLCGDPEPTGELVRVLF